MSVELLACIIVVAVIGVFLLWRLPVGRRIKKEEEQFIEDYRSEYAILIFYGSEFELKEVDLVDIKQVESYYGTTTYAIPSGIYSSTTIFDYNYSGGIRPQKGYTGRIYKELNLLKGNVYRYRLKEQSVMNKKIKYKMLWEETAVSRPLDYYRQEHTVLFEELS